MAKEFKLEDRYIVLKRSDLEKLPDGFRYQLSHTCDAVNSVRKDRNTGELKCLVIEHDWPEFESFRALLGIRVVAHMQFDYIDTQAELSRLRKYIIDRVATFPEEKRKVQEEIKVLETKLFSLEIQIKELT